MHVRAHKLTLGFDLCAQRGPSSMLCRLPCHGVTHVAQSPICCSGIACRAGCIKGVIRHQHRRQGAAAEGVRLGVTSLPALCVTGHAHFDVLA
eukprot:scaffold95413_cov15-Tisochrysis_lutea.AAC.1